MKNLLITGGAGFIGCALSNILAEKYDRIIALDNLHPQIHPKRIRPEQLNEKVELVLGDVTVRSDWDSLLKTFKPDEIIHLAAETGTGESLTESFRHANVNVTGTAQMMDALQRNNALPRVILLTSSRAVYGEGVWERNGVQFYPGQRTEKMLSEHRWDFEQAHYLPMSAESTLPRPTSIYGATKLAQENMLASWCNSFGVQMKTTRLQNVYGAGQSLYNSSTGIVTLFARMARKHKSIPVYEDGNIVRDFIYIDDIARGIARVLESEAATGKTIDLGTGVPTTIMEAAGEISQIYGAPYPHITGQYRNGDVRAAVCDVSATESLIGWRAAVDLHEGLGRLCAWVDKKLDAEEHITDFKDR